MSDASGTAGTSVEARGFREVADALDRLEHVDRVALHLIYWRGLTEAQVAAELSLPAGRIRTAVARGLRQVSEHLTGSTPARIDESTVRP